METRCPQGLGEYQLTRQTPKEGPNKLTQGQTAILPFHPSTQGSGSLCIQCNVSTGHEDLTFRSSHKQWC